VAHFTGKQNRGTIELLEIESAMSDTASREAAFKAGVNDFLAKLWCTTDVRRILEKVWPIPEQPRVTAA
jgi:hypothetical protein